MIRVRELLDVIDAIAPWSIAMPGDPVGLQIGDPDQIVSSVGVAMDPDKAKIGKCHEAECRALVVHHPLIYRPLTSLLNADPVHLAVRDCVHLGISLIAAHTNWDNAVGGVNDALAQAIGLQKVEPFGEGGRMGQLKIAVFVPARSTSKVIGAMSEAGAGLIGNYERCAFYSEGVGTFRPGKAARPHIGKAGKIEKVREHRIEMIVDERQLGSIVSAMIAAHPYEEVAYDVYRLEQPKLFPMGRVGSLPKSVNLEQLAEYVGLCLDQPAVRAYGRPPARIKRVAVLGGSGGDYLRAAKAAGADALVTGEARHHQTIEAEQLKIGLIDAGHRETEAPGVAELARRLAKAVDAKVVLLD
ncbi:MAG: Nif3-like dinuclear metal center hexameric protein [Armatimonadetes bacterium]|nr:Nif3-like dinuclear metal center hexameric protein [Armatimonadota bacterium]